MPINLCGKLRFQDGFWGLKTQHRRKCTQKRKLDNTSKKRSLMYPDINKVRYFESPNIHPQSLPLAGQPRNGTLKSAVLVGRAIRGRETALYPSVMTMYMYIHCI